MLCYVIEDRIDPDPNLGCINTATRAEGAGRTAETPKASKAGMPAEGGLYSGQAVKKRLPVSS